MRAWHHVSPRTFLLTTSLATVYLPPHRIEKPAPVIIHPQIDRFSSFLLLLSLSFFLILEADLDCDMYTTAPPWRATGSSTLISEYTFLAGVV